MALAEQATKPSVAKPLGKKIYTRDPKPATPPLYSAAVSYGNLLFIAGKSSHGTPPGEIRADTKYAPDEIEKELINAGSSMDKVIKVNVFLNDVKDYAAMNEVFAGRFGSEPPARTTVGALIPRGTTVEIDVVAFI
ncbi:MAG: Endoribonuclease [Acidobacteriaceae bacterium]|nr:Endoribonuclease [Acidobacteriaceae bacterium]